MDVWIERSTAQISEKAMIILVGRTLQKMLVAIHYSVSEVTLAAVLDRVLYNSSEQHSVLKGIKANGIKLNFAGLKNVRNENMQDAFHYLITEFIYIIGNLTAERLTPVLYQVLEHAKVTAPATKATKATKARQINE